jgi:uncharacterized membrane protein YhfC
MDFAKVGGAQFAVFIIGSILFLLVPVLIAIIWKIKKKERFTTVLVGAGAFVLFALILEKPIQNILVFPTTMMLPDHAIARFINARPLLWAIIVGLFPGVFEETGRFIAFKTILNKRKNRETSISYGIGHGGIEVMILLGVAYLEYIMYAVLINTGAFKTIVEQAAAQAPAQAIQLKALSNQLAAFSFADLGIGAVERVFAVLFHIGASILVFYACRDKGKFWLYPLAIILHTLMDSFAGMTMVSSYIPGAENIINMPAWGIEIFVAVFGGLVFFLSYFLLYRREKEI